MSDGPASTTEWRLRRLEEDMRAIKALKLEVQVDRLENLAEKVDTLTATVEAFRKAIIQASLTFAGSTLVAAFSVLLAMGKI